MSLELRYTSVSEQFTRSTSATAVAPAPHPGLVLNAARAARRGCGLGLAPWFPMAFPASPRVLSDELRISALHTASTPEVLSLLRPRSSIVSDLCDASALASDSAAFSEIWLPNSESEHTLPVFLTSVARSATSSSVSFVSHSKISFSAPVSFCILSTTRSINRIFSGVGGGAAVPCACTVFPSAAISIHTAVLRV